MCETSAQRDAAVYGREICFSYSKTKPILKGINITVNRGTIYGLLGSSGCGKTTLLKCILGRLQPNNGEILIFGKTPGSPECHIPGAGIGYMPQELGLLFEFTVEELLAYFGKIYAMKKDEIDDKVDKLTKLLHLPRTKDLIGNLSGGQQRRVSMACALIHSPPLLILDEPTVGTDPVLRQDIWLHLLSLCKSGQTIILTTHYIEEAGSADTVAFMRSGTILAEDDPEVLLEKYSSNKLEEVFLKLCLFKTEDSNKENDKKRDFGPKNASYCYINEITDDLRDEIKLESIQFSNENIKQSAEGLQFKNRGQHLDIRRLSVELNRDNSVLCIPMVKIDGPDDCKEISRNNGINQNILLPIRNSRFTDKCSALLHKNYKRITRNIGHMVFEITLTSLLLIIITTILSDGPTNLNLAIFDEEVNTNASERWGQLFVESIEKGIFNFDYFDSLDEAIDSVKSGKSHAAVDINKGFTKALRLRFLYLGDTDEDTIEESQIYVHIDRSNQLVGLQIEALLYHAMMNFIKVAANRSNTNPDILKVPLVMEEPVYGNKKETLREFILPGVYIALTYFSTATVTAHLIYEERKDGLLERSLVAGITATEFVVSNILTQSVILCFQIFILILLPYIVVSRQITGSFTLFIALTLSQGLAGVAFGLMISVIMTDIIQIALVIFFLFFTSMTTGGVLWPIENMNQIMQTLSQLMPNSVAIQSLRYTMFRNWTIDYFEVYIGFVSTYVWFSIFILISMIVLKRNF